MRMIYVVVCVGVWVGGCYNMPKTSCLCRINYNGTYCGELWL